MKKQLLVLFLFISLTAFCQTQIPIRNIQISKYDVVIKTEKVFDCKAQVPVGSVLKTETVKKGKDKTYIITTERKAGSSEEILVEK